MKIFIGGDDRLFCIFADNSSVIINMTDDFSTDSQDPLHDITDDDPKQRGFYEDSFVQKTETAVSRTIRPATEADIPCIMPVFDDAREKMQASGNWKQWINGYPSVEAVQNDIRRDGGFVIEDDGKIVGYFAFLPSPEPTYKEIFGGQWLDDTRPYHVIHRMGGLHGTHGIFSSVMDFAFACDPNIRIDTHRDNVIMQHNLAKHGFTYCGIIYLLSGDERLAYQKI